VGWKPKCLEPVKKGLTHSAEKFEEIREKCIAYFEGQRVDFRTIPTYDNDGHMKADISVTVMGEEKGDEKSAGQSSFASKCRQILQSHVGYGETTSYGELAEMCGYSRRHARVVARVMASNPIPLIVPCHRVVTASGRLSGFSAEGGVEMKKKMLALEGVKKWD
jgi:O-6-methylguanine DNA methyltransferase